MPAIISISNFNFTDTNWESGDDIAITFTLQNTGTETLSYGNVEVKVQDANGNYLLDLDSFTAPDVPAGQTINVTGSIPIRNTEMAAGNYAVYLNLNDYESINEVSTVLSFSTPGVAPLTIYDDVYFTPGTGTYDALAGDDRVIGSAADETIFGNVGNDRLDTEGGDNTVYGGNGDDEIYVTYATIIGGFRTTVLPGANELYGGAGEDYFNSNGLDDTIYGGADDDTIAIRQIDVTQVEADTHSGTTIYGGGGDDDITSHAQGVQAIIGATIYGNSGDDLIVSTNLSDVVLGGSGADTIDFSPQPFIDLSGNNYPARTGAGATIKGGSGADMITGSSLADNIKGGTGDDIVNGGIGADLIKGGGGADNLNGQRGDDTIKGGGGADIINGNKGADHLSGGSGGDTINGSRGNDSLFGNKGDDKLIGGKGSDTIDGGKGDDLINGGKGSDVLAGGIGADTFEFSVGDGNNRIEDFEDGVDLIHINANTSTQGSLIVANHADGALITFANVTIIVEDMHYTDITLADITF